MDITKDILKINTLNFNIMNSFKYVLPAYIQKGVILSPPSHSLIFSGKFCQCGSPLYERADGKIICKGCANPKPIKKS